MKKMTILELVEGNKEMEKEVMKHCKKEDDPPVLFEWNGLSLEQFLTKAVAYGVGGGVHRPPPQIFGGIHPVGPPTSESIRQLQLGLLVYLSFQSQHPPLIGSGAGRAVGLACTGLQFAAACVQLGLMNSHPWFQSVLANGDPLTESLATAFMPRPNVKSGLCDQIPIGAGIWS